MALGLRYAARSDVGLVREGNEDSGYSGSWLLAVADGMGGHAAGELASAMAVATFAEVADAPLPEDEALSILGDAVDLASERIANVIADEPRFQGMGTTFTALAWLRDRLALVHVGDSRAYRYRDGELVQLTKDHTYVQTLVDSGQITAEEAITHPRRNLIMRAIDGIHAVEPDLSIRDLQLGDRYLLCTDGLSGVVRDDALAEQLSHGEPTGVVARLVELALEGGAPDNVTVVVADVVSAPDDNGHGAALPVVVGAAGEARNRRRLPNVPWPVDGQFDPESGQSEPESAAPSDAEAAGDVDREDGVRAPRWRNPVVLVVGAVIGVLALVGVSLIWWVSTQWYVGNNQGEVAIYQGVPGRIGPIPLQRVTLETNIPVASLPAIDSDRVNQGILVDSQEQAYITVAQLDQRAQACEGIAPPEGCPTTATDTATTTTTGGAP
jgi:protein phosphatase